MDPFEKIAADLGAENDKKAGLNPDNSGANSGNSEDAKASEAKKLADEKKASEAKGIEGANSAEGEKKKEVGGNEGSQSAEPGWFDKHIKPKYGDKYKDENEFFESIEKQPTQVEVEKIVEKEVYPDELTAKLAEFVKKGGTHEDFYKTQFTDWDKVPAEKLLKEKLRQEYPKASDKQIDLKFKERYDLLSNIPEDDLTDDQRDKIELAKLSIEADADKFRAEKNEQKVKILDRQPPQPTANELEAQKKELEYKTKWAENAPLVVNNFKELKFDIDYADETGNKETYSLSHEVDAKTKEFVTDVVKDPTKLFALVRDKNGLLDANAIAQLAYFKLNGGNVISEIANKLAGEVKENFIKKNLKNASFTHQAHSGQSAKKSDKEADLELAVKQSAEQRR